MASITIEETPPQRAAPRSLATGFTALRIFFGLVWLSNGLASKTQIAPLGAFYRDIVLPHRDFAERR